VLAHESLASAVTTSLPEISAALRAGPRIGPRIALPN